MVINHSFGALLRDTAVEPMVWDSILEEQSPLRD